MKDIGKNRFLVWLMYAIPIACTGLFSLCIWTWIQIALYCHETNKYKVKKVQLKERGCVVEMNKMENLTEKDLEIMKQTGATIKLKEGVYGYDRK